MNSARTTALAMAFVLGASAAAAAACGDQVSELEQQLAQLESQGSEESEQAPVRTSSGEVQVEAESAGSQPQENWFGTPASVEGAQQELDNARTAAENGDEEMCRQHVEQAQKIIDGLER